MKCFHRSCLLVSLSPPHGHLFYTFVLYCIAPLHTYSPNRNHPSSLYTQVQVKVLTTMMAAGKGRLGGYLVLRTVLTHLPLHIYHLFTPPSQLLRHPR